MKYLQGVIILLALSVFCVGGLLADNHGTDEVLRIAWAEWPPADYLQELSKDFTQETGIGVEIVQIPWPNFQEKVSISFSGRSELYDIVIGDSQWLGVNSKGGHYIKLTDWINQNIEVSEIYGPAMTAFAEYPKGSSEYWALPAEVDANGYVYRTDLFEDSAEQKAFQDKYGYQLEPPKTYKQLRDIAEFFTRPDQNLYGIATDFSKEYDGITMGFQQVMWSFGGSYSFDGSYDDPKTYKGDGYLNSEDSVKALEYYKGLVAFSPPDAPNYYWQETLEAY